MPKETFTNPFTRATEIVFQDIKASAIAVSIQMQDLTTSAATPDVAEPPTPQFPGGILEEG